LYYRLGVATIDLPPLCERPGDIVPLARHFIGLYATRLKLDTIELSEEAQSVLLGYEWPGNIRELENVIHYALIVCRGHTIAADDLKLSGIHLRRPAAVLPEPLPERRVMALPHSGPAADPGEGRTGAGTAGLAGRLESLFAEFLDAGQPALFDLVEQALIGSVFARFRQNQVQTARALGISRNILRAHLKRYGLIGSLQPGAGGEEGEPGAIAAAN
jgi:sigma-54-specific transcriptional regulator